MNFKKLGLIILFLLVTVGVGYLLYRFFFAPPVAVVPPDGTATTTPPTGGGLPPAGEGRPITGIPGPPATGLPEASPIANGGPTESRTVTPSAVLSPTLTSAGSLTYYDANDGKFYRVQPDGSVVAISDRVFPSVSDIEWSPDAGKAVIEFPDASKVIYDFDAQKQVSLPRHWEDFSFTGDGQTVVAKSLGVDPDNRWLISFSSDGTDAQLIAPLGDNEDKVIVDAAPDSGTLAFAQTADPVGFNTRDILLIGPNNENQRALRIEGFGFTPLWDTTGQNLLYSAASGEDEFIPSLWFSGAKGESIGSNRVDLGIRTWADKCTFADAGTVYCAVPDGLPSGSGLERGVAEGIPDSIWRIDLASGTSSVVGRPAIDQSISTLLVAPDGSKLYFTDDAGTLQEMRLR